MAGLKRRHNKFEARVRVPKDIREAGGPAFRYKTLSSGDRRAAKAEALHWETELRAEWAVQMGHDTPALSSIRAMYERVRAEAAQSVTGSEAELRGIEQAIDVLADEVGEGELTPAQAARLAGLQDAAKDLQRLPVEPRRELEPSFNELAEEYVRWWKAQGGLKGNTNTEQQKRATFGLFGGFWRNRPLRDVTRADAARFMDAVRLLDPSWARSPANRELPWDELQRRLGNRERGLSDATMNRHAATLQALWAWAAERHAFDGRNPFEGFRRRLRQGVNVQGYVAWEPAELARLFNPPPRRRDLMEAMLVALFTGMRLDEIASLRGDQLRKSEKVTFIQVEDAKTPAGNRQVPLHRRLDWLMVRAREAGTGPIWPTFNPEGPGKKAGADAGREFSRFKQQRGFKGRQKAFHSFRKNVTRIMERAGVPENEWAQVFGHERGFTFGVYNPDGITLQRKAKIIGLIDYPGLTLPRPPRSP